jgi:hypothetical protein
MILAIFDLTRSILCIGNLVGESFKETLGTREGAIESPHLFNVYIGDLRERLEGLHPRLCKLLHITIAVLLYADDAALPADSFEDLELSATIFEEFCNDKRLYISTGKSYITVFHSDGDEQVIYQGDSIWVDGKKLTLRIYGQTIAAARTFKYLGVMLDSCCGQAAHLETRYTATLRAGSSLNAGLVQIPGAPHRLAQYLFQSLVKPVALYGVELFTIDAVVVVRFKSLQTRFWRRMLRIGGRAPQDVTAELMGIDCVTIEWRVRRVGLLLRLLNSPPDSWQHIALMWFMMNTDGWLQAALADLQIVIPSANLEIGHGPAGPFLFTTGAAAQPRGLRQNSCGRKSRTPMAEGLRSDEIRLVQQFTRDVTRRLRQHLAGAEMSARRARLSEQMHTNAFGKSQVAAKTILTNDLSLSLVLAWIEVPCHATALAAFAAGDFFLGRYAGNYFAKPLLPSCARHRKQLEERNLEASRVCLHCWHYKHELHLEGEDHLIFDCSLYSLQRRDLLEEMSSGSLQVIRSATTGAAKLEVLLGSNTRQDWQSLSKFLARVRQIRRRSRTKLQDLGAQRERRSFDTQKARWRKEGKFVCRHGVFFEVGHSIQCACLGAPLEADWSFARLMPALDPTLKCVVTDSFDPHSFQRLGCIQAEMRRRNW